MSNIASVSSNGYHESDQESIGLSNTESLQFLRNQSNKKSNKGSVNGSVNGSVGSRNFVNHMLAELNEEPTGGAGGPNNMFRRYNEASKPFSNAENFATALRIRSHGKAKVLEAFPDWNQSAGKRRKTHRKNRKNRKNRKTRQRKTRSRY
jgi:hypothetical protein